MNRLVTSARSWGALLRPAGARCLSTAASPEQQQPKQQKVSGSMDLFEELAGYGEKKPGQEASQQPEEPKKSTVKSLISRQPMVHGSPRRLQLIATALVGKSYEQAKADLDVLRRNSGAKAALRAVENAKRRAWEKWSVTDERRLVVEQAWTGKATTSPRLRIHARGKSGRMHRRWGKLWVKVRYISEEDDALLLQRMKAALDKHGVEKHRVRYLLRYGPRKTVFAVSRESGLTRQQGRAYLKMLSETLDEFRKPKCVSKSKLRALVEAGAAAAATSPASSPAVAAKQ